MKTLIRKSTIAVAVSVVLGSSAAWAEEFATTTVNADNDTSVTLYKKVDVNKDLDLTGTVEIQGKVLVNSNSLAVVDNKQLNHNNFVDSPDPSFTATTGVITGNAGNLGVNVTAGENNQQDNAAAIAATDASFVLGSTDAETFTQQRLWENETHLTGAQLNATTQVDGNTGNVGVNVSAGVSNLQKNNLAISTGHSGLAEASSATLQETTSINTTLTDGISPSGVVPVSYTSTLTGVSGNTGNTGVNLATGSNNMQANSLAIASVN